MLTRELLARLPKAELHTHLDSALRPATMVELAREAKFALPTTDPDALRRFMVVSDAGSLEDYLARFEYTIPLLQTAEGIERVSYEMVEDAARDGLRYLEVRYCPKLSTRGGLTMAAALEAELRGLARGERDFGVITRVINCSLRHYAPEVSLAIARLSVAYRDRGVVAFDLAGGEAGRPPGVHQAAFDVAADGCLGITVHAGEAAGAQSIAEAVHRCHADRGPSSPRLSGRRAGGHALHRRVAHDRRDPDRRVLAGAPRAGVHADRDRPLHPRRLRQRVSPLARAAGPRGTGDGRAGGAAVSGGSSHTRSG
jgi:adenosine deaminase